MTASRPTDLNEVLRHALDRSMQDLVDLQEQMPIERWNETVFRFYFGLAIARAYPHLTQLVEAARIDLVLCEYDWTAFIECKFYLKRHRRDPYSAAVTGIKGGPGRQNESEFVHGIDRLAQRPHAAGLRRFILLVFADPAAASPHHRQRFGDYLSEYQHPTREVRVTDLHQRGSPRHR